MQLAPLADIRRGSVSDGIYTARAVVVSRYAGRFSLGILTDETIDSASAQEFLQLYASTIAETAGNHS